MKIIGIVAEYNPFHRGHKLQIDATRAIYPNSVIVAVMSGDYVQRGEAASFDKHIRAKAAIAGGADLVIELPLPWSIASAEGFARGAVGLLNDLAVVDMISFGSECGDVAKLQEVADALVCPEIGDAIRQELKSGISYAEARSRAIHLILGEKAELVSKPNNILAIEYIKQLKLQNSNIQPMTIARQGAAHDEKGDGKIRSASEIRSMMNTQTQWNEFIPEAAAQVYSAAKPIDRQRFELIQLSRLRMMDRGNFGNLPDEAEGLGNRLYKAVQQGRSMEEVLAFAKSKRYAMSRIRRMLLCATLGVEKTMSEGKPEYARILASNRQGISLLNEIVKHSDLHIVTKPAHSKNLSEKPAKCFEITSKARNLYTLAHENLEKRTIGDDFRTSPHIES